MPDSVRSPCLETSSRPYVRNAAQPATALEHTNYVGIRGHLIHGDALFDVKTIDQAKECFKAAWLAFKTKHGPEAQAKAFAEMNHATRPDRYRR